MGWDKHARESAAKEFGSKNYERFYRRRRRGQIAAAVVALGVLGWVLLPRVNWSALTPGWVGGFLVVALCVVAGLSVLLIARQVYLRTGRRRYRTRRWRIW